MGLQPGRVSLGFLVTLEQRQNGLGRVSEGRKVNDVLAMQLLLDILEDLFNFLPVHVLQGAQHILVEVLFRPLVGGFHDIVQGDRLLLPEDVKRADEQDCNEPELSHRHQNTPKESNPKPAMRSASRKPGNVVRTSVEMRKTGVEVSLQTVL